MELEEGISVIICCYNSEWIIERTLSALKKQYCGDSLFWEIILVDNNSTDNTVNVARKTMNSCGIPFTIVKESKLGLANARKRGIIAARYSIVVYCDDDNLLCPHYISTVFDIMRSDPLIGAVGGMGIAEFLAEPDPIVKKNIEFYAIGSQLGNDCWLYGAGLTLRTLLVRDIYEHQKCYLMGRKGNDLLSGDDTELVMSIVLRGYKIAPTNQVSFVHVLKANRLTKDYFYKMYKGIVITRPLFEVFRAAIFDRPFNEIEKKYINAWKSVIWGIFFMWNEDASKARSSGFKIIKLYNFWGLCTLKNAYNEWKEIKKRTNF